MFNIFKFIFLYLMIITLSIANERTNKSLFLNYLKEKQKEHNSTKEDVLYFQLDNISIEKPHQRLNNKNQSINILNSDIEINPSSIYISFPTNLEPYPKDKKFYKYNKPLFIKGLYINNLKIFKNDVWQLIEQAKKHGINTLVIDIQPNIVPKEIIKELLSKDFYLIARIVVFENGLNKYPPSKEHLLHIQKLTERADIAIRNGFQEIQLDYIRFADNHNLNHVPLEKKYRLIAGILKLFEDKLRIYGVRLGADIFGRVPFYENDIIGQKIEIFDKYLDHLHPMLYPSHFYGMEDKIKNPYQTVFEGVKKSKSRVKNVEIIPYIQAFKMSVNKTGLSYKEYIYHQIQAVYDSNAEGFIAWNASNDYKTFFLAMKDFLDKNKTYNNIQN